MNQGEFSTTFSGEQTVRIDMDGLESGHKTEIRADAPIDLQKLGVADRESMLAQLTRKPPEKYIFRKSLGKGGMKMVIQVKDRDTMRDIAMAMLPDAANLPAEDTRRFIEEARITASLEHPNIVPVHDIGVDRSGSPYFTMKLLRGETLAAILKKIEAGDTEYQFRYNLEQRLRIFLKICNAVAFAHSKGVLHLDLKPENVQIGDFGEVLLMDWGLAKVISHQDSAPAGKRNPVLPAADGVTLDGITKGTPGYMAPEQAAGKNSLKDFRTDIYALGAILYALTTLKNPLTDRGDFKQMMEDTVRGNIQPPRKRTPELEIPTALEAVIQKAMSVRPENRYQDVRALRNEVFAFLGGFATKAERAGVFKRSFLFIRRHKISFPAVMLSLILLLGVTYYAVKENSRQKGDWIQLYDGDFAKKEFSSDKITFYNSTIYSRVPAWEHSGKGLRMRPKEWLWLNGLKLTGNARIILKLIPSSTDRITVTMNSDASPMKYAWNFPSGYSVVFGGYSGTMDLLCKGKENGGREVLASAPSGIIPHKLNTIIIEREEGHFIVTLNHQIRIDTSDLLPLAASNSGLFGIRAEGKGTILQSVTISRQAFPVKSSPLLAGDVLLARKHYQEAVEQYLITADNYPAGPITDEALVKAYFTAVNFLPNAEDRKKITQEIKQRLTPRLANFKYRSKIMELDALTLWVDGNYRQALKIAEDLFLMNPETEIIQNILQLPHPVLPEDAVVSLLEGIRKTRGLTRINLSGLGVHSLKQLSGLPITYLDCSGNLLDSLEGLEYMPLEMLDCSGNRISSLEPLRGIPLQNLSCAGNRIVSLEPLNTSELKTLNASYNEISDLEPLKDAVLETLSIRRNKIKSLQPLAKTNLKVLDAGENPFTTLTPLCGMPLETLYVDHSLISNLQPVQDMQLTSLSLFNCKNLKDLSPLFGMISLQMLSLPPEPENILPLKELPFLFFITDQSIIPQSEEAETAEAYWNRHGK